MPSQSIQQSYSIYPDIGYVGTIAQPTAPHATASGLISVPDGTTAPRPGHALYYNTANNRFALPLAGNGAAAVASRNAVCGILGYRMDTVAGEDDQVSFEDGDEIQFFVFGTVWVRAGTAMEYGQALAWQPGDQQWDVSTRSPATAPANLNAVPAFVEAALASLTRYPVVCVSRDPVSAGGIAMAQIGYGRVA